MQNIDRVESDYTQSASGPRKSLRQIATEEAAELVSRLFSQHGLIPDRKSFTTDSSVLFQFLSEPQACVDIYPNGKAIVIIRGQDITEVNELSVADAEQIIRLLRHGRAECL